MGTMKLQIQMQYAWKLPLIHNFPKLTEASCRGSLPHLKLRKWNNRTDDQSRRQ